MRICVIIPTFNEFGHIANLINGIKAYNLDILIIDDGSSDNTSKIAQDCGANVLINTSNLGKGASLIKGFDYALSHEYEAVITMDGDGQHSPEDLKGFIQLYNSSKSAIFIGNRMQNPQNMPFARIITNKIMSLLISIISRQKIPDTQCGFRLIRRNALETLKLKTSKYETESEILLQAAKNGFKIESMPIKVIYDSERSSINPFIDTIRFIKFIITTKL